jgi:hypothetical protein
MNVEFIIEGPTGILRCQQLALTCLRPGLCCHVLLRTGRRGDGPFSRSVTQSRVIATHIVELGVLRNYR